MADFEGPKMDFEALSLKGPFCAGPFCFFPRMFFTGKMMISSLKSTGCCTQQLERSLPLTWFLKERQDYGQVIFTTTSTTSTSTTCIIIIILIIHHHHHHLIKHNPTLQLFSDPFSKISDFPLRSLILMHLERRHGKHVHHVLEQMASTANFSAMSRSGSS